MKVRPIQSSDIPILNTHAEASAFPYPDLDQIEGAVVIIGDDGEILTACVAEKLVQLYLYPIIGAPASKLRLVELLHGEMAKVLRQKGYHSCEVFIPPQIADSFGRRLE